MIKLIFILALVVFILQQFTTLNIISSHIFFKKKLSAYPYMEDGAHTKNYVLEHIKCHLPPRVLYNPKGNFFLIYGHCKIQKRDAFGKQVFVMNYNAKDMGYLEFSPYVFTANGVWDFTMARVEKQIYAKVINKNQTLTAQNWNKTYHTLYKKASQVVYGNAINYNDTFSVYYKIDGLWYKLHAIKGMKYNARGGYVTVGNNLLPEKYEPLVLLKDYNKKQYSNYFNEDDVALHSIKKHYAYKYSKTNNLSCSSMLYKKSGHIEMAPFGLDCDRYYTYNIKGDVLKFKEAAIKGFLGGWTNFLQVYQVPEKYKNKTDVVFLEYKYLNHYHDGRSMGMYIIREK